MIRPLLPRKKQIGKQSLMELMHQMITSIRRHKVLFYTKSIGCYEIY